MTTCIVPTGNFFVPGYGSWVDGADVLQPMKPHDVYNDEQRTLTKLLEHCVCMQHPEVAVDPDKSLDEGLDVSHHRIEGLPPGVLYCIPPVALALLGMRDELMAYDAARQQSELQKFVTNIRPLGRLLAIALCHKLLTVEQLVTMDGVSNLFANPTSRTQMWTMLQQVTERHMQGGTSDTGQFNRAASAELSRAFTRMLTFADSLDATVSVGLVIIFTQDVVGWVGGTCVLTRCFYLLFVVLFLRAPAEKRGISNWIESRNR